MFEAAALAVALLWAWIVVLTVAVGYLLLGAWGGKH